MTDREKLVELMQEAVRKWWLDGGDDSNIEYVADYLISKGVTIPVRCGECKWGHSYERYDGTEGTECGKYGSCGMADDFCSRGERKEE